MRRAASIRAAAALAALLVASCIVPRALAGNVVFNTPPAQPIHVAASDDESQPMTLGISKSVVVDLPRDVKDVLVADPKIANAVVRSSRRVFIIGSTVGQTNVYFFDAEGKQIAGFDVAVTRDLDGIRQAIHQVLPDSDITVEGIGDGVILSGSVSSPVESQQAFDIAARLLGVAHFRRGSERQQNRQCHRRARPRSDHAQSRRRRSRARRHQAARHQSCRLVQLWHRRGQLQQHQSVFRHRAVAQRFEHHRRLFLGQRDVAGDGTGRRHSYARRAEPDRDFRRIRNIRRRRRISGAQRLQLLDRLPAAAYRAVSRRSISRNSASASTSRRSC